MKLICAYCKKPFHRNRVKPKVINHFCCRGHFQLWKKEQVILNKCLVCGKDTLNPKFCSRSCSATYTNKQHPKRHLEGNCMICNKIIPTKRTYCKECYKKTISNVDYSTITLKELKAKRTSYPHSRIRQLARNSYIKEQRPQECIICGYSTFFHICHIKAIQDFNNDTPISIINTPSNLVALCPNHHIEFDNGLLQL